MLTEGYGDGRRPTLSRRLSHSASLSLSLSTFLFLSLSACLSLSVSLSLSTSVFVSPLSLSLSLSLVISLLLSSMPLPVSLSLSLALSLYHTLSLSCPCSLWFRFVCLSSVFVCLSFSSSSVVGLLHPRPSSPRRLHLPSTSAVTFLMPRSHAVPNLQIPGGVRMRLEAEVLTQYFDCGHRVRHISHISCEHAPVC